MSEEVEETREMGFDPKRGNFLVAVQLIGVNKSTWDREWDLYRKWGWSETEILSAFRRKPMFMAVSDEKLERVMDFLVNRMGWDVSEIAVCPGVFIHSLENWTIPRCLVVQFLLSKGVIKKDFSSTVVIVPTEKQFLIRFVDQHCERFPEVLNLYGRPKDDISIYKLPEFPLWGKRLI